MQGLEWGRELDFRAIVAVPDGNTLRVWLPSKADPTHAPASKPFHYVVETPQGPNIVTSATVASDQNSILLTLERTLPAADCTLHIESGTIRGIGGAYISATALPFRGSSTVEPEPLPVDPLLALLVIPTGSTLRILFGAQLDPEHAATTDRFQYQVTGPKGALSITSVTLHSDGRSVVLQLAAPFPVGEGTVKIAAGAARSWPGETLNHETVLPVLVPKPEEPPVPVPTELLPPWSFVVSTGETIALNVRPSQASFVVTNAALELDAGDSDVEIKIR